MFSLLLASSTPAHDAAESAAHGAAGSDGLVHELVTKFGIDGVNVGMQLISFAFLAFVLYRFAIKPTLATMDERNRQIEAGLKNAEATAAQLADAQKQVAAQLKAAQVEANKIVEDARKAAKELSDRETTAATERANALLAKANEAAELERKKIMAEAQREIARLVVATTERVLAKQLTDADRAAYNQAAARELASV